MNITSSDKKRLDRMFGAALLYDSVCERLLQHDRTLWVDFGISPAMQQLLDEVDTDDLFEYAESVQSRIGVSVRSPRVVDFKAIRAASEAARHITG